MLKYEHKVIKSYFKSFEKLEADLAYYAEEGWEVAGVGQSLGNMIIILKRPSQNRPKPPPKRENRV